MVALPLKHGAHSRCVSPSLWAYGFFFSGASVDSYLPDNLSFDRVVGIGMNDEEMRANPKLTERLVQNLNKEVPGTYELHRGGGEANDFFF